MEPSCQPATTAPGGHGSGPAVRGTAQGPGRTAWNGSVPGEYRVLLSTRGTAGCCTGPGTEPAPGAGPRGAWPRSPHRERPDAAAASGARGNRAAWWPAAECTVYAPAGAGPAAVP